jgi:hypothetical protein
MQGIDVCDRKVWEVEEIEQVKGAKQVEDVYIGCM